MGFLAILLTAIFITLKVTHVVAWSWLIVLSPLIAAVVLAVIFLVVMAVVFGAVAQGIGRGLGW